MNKTDNHTTYIQGLQADIDKLKASLPTITDDYEKDQCVKYIKALDETCALCGGICDRCYYTEACERYNGTGTETPVVRNGFVIG